MLEGVFAIDRLLRSGGAFSLEHLAHETEAHPRTVQRYIEVLRERLGADVIFDRARAGYVYGADALGVPAAHLDEQELLALFIAEPVLAQYEGTPLAEDFRRAWARVTGGLPRTVLDRVQRARSRLSIPIARPAREDLERFRTVFDAAMDDHQLAITYFSAHRGAKTQRTVDPYALRAVAGDWYLVAHCHRRNAVVPFKLARIRTAVRLARRFSRPADLDIDALFENSFGIYRLPAVPEGGPPDPITLRFDAATAVHIRDRVWHPSQELEDLTDGGVLLHLQVDPTPELDRWIRSWGDGVERVEQRKAERNDTA